MTHHLKDLYNTGGCTAKRTSYLRLPGLNFTIALLQVLNLYLMRKWMRVGMILIIHYSCKLFVCDMHVTNLVLQQHDIPLAIYLSLGSSRSWTIITIIGSESITLESAKTKKR